VLAVSFVFDLLWVEALRLYYGVSRGAFIFGPTLSSLLLSTNSWSSKKSLGRVGRLDNTRTSGGFVRVAQLI
jgi:hypothetical protein